MARNLFKLPPNRRVLARCRPRLRHRISRCTCSYDGFDGSWCAGALVNSNDTAAFRAAVSRAAWAGCGPTNVLVRGSRIEFPTKVPLPRRYGWICQATALALMIAAAVPNPTGTGVLPVASGEAGAAQSFLCTGKLHSPAHAAGGPPGYGRSASPPTASWSSTGGVPSVEDTCISLSLYSTACTIAPLSKTASRTPTPPKMLRSCSGWESRCRTRGPAGRLFAVRPAPLETGRVATRNWLFVRSSNCVL